MVAVRRFVPIVLVVLALLGPATAAPAAESSTATAVRHAGAFALDRLARTVATLPTSAYPNVAKGTAPWTTTTASDWVSGFFPGQLWLAYQLTGNAVWARRAKAWQAGIESQKTNTTTHDLGFMLYDSFGNGQRLTGDAAMRQVLLDAAASLSTRYSSTVHAVRAWNDSSVCHQFIVIIDTMMNLELLLWASAHGGPAAYRDEAVQHALTTLANLVRPDGSTYHYACFNEQTGQLMSRGTVQGYSDDSTWSRGQAWAMSGFTTAYRETRDPRFLAVARRTSDWFLGHLPGDAIPRWDFSAPATATTPRDTSAAAVAATGLLELARIDPDSAHRTKYTAGALRLVRALTQRPWLSEGSGSAAVLLHGSQNVPAGSKDTGLVFGDYYLLRALLGLRLLPTSWPALPVSRVTASSALPGDPPRAALDGNVRTYWGARGPAWLRLDLGTVRTVRSVSVAWHRGDRRSAHFRIDTSVDGVHWSAAIQALSSGQVTTGETYDVPDRDVRYVRLVGVGNTEDSSVAVSEVRVR